MSRGNGVCADFVSFCSNYRIVCWIHSSAIVACINLHKYRKAHIKNISSVQYHRENRKCLLKILFQM